MKLTDSQKDVIRKIIKDLEIHKFVTLGGYAGTGKTTCIKTIFDALSQKGLKFECCAYTGKAANVLSRKGIPASTIHSIIYRRSNREEKRFLELDWTLKSSNEIGNLDGFIIDEASMVSKEIHNDLLSYELPILYVGDHGQLEPIGDKFNLMAEPMHRLEEIHRNAGEIAHFAHHLRCGNSSTSFQSGDKVQVVKSFAIEDKHLAMVDQIICAFNKTRVSINECVRRYKNLEYTSIAIGEKIICLRNHKKIGIFNGMQGIVTEICNLDKFNFISNGIQFIDIEYNVNQWGKEKNEFDFDQREIPFDYAYAITAHKAQGDEFNSLIVMEQVCSKWDHRKWAYTAASRAKDHLIWATSNYNF